MEQTNPLLLLTGDTNSGKSFLVSVVSYHLQRNAGKGPARTLAAYHFFPKRTEKSGQDPRPVETALKCMALQIAEQNAAYAKSISNFCESKDDEYFKNSPCKELWEVLKFATPKGDLTYFLLFDGVDQLSSANAEQLLDILGTLHKPSGESEQSQTRVLVSGMTDTFNNGRFQSVPKIQIEQSNDADIKSYIERELKDRDLLQGRDSETAKFRSTIYKKLPDLAQGNFFKVQNAIDKIDDAVASDGSPEELEKILNEAGQNRETIAQNVIEELSELLSAKEIEELNEILVWVVYGILYFDLNELQAALVSPPFAILFLTGVKVPEAGWRGVEKQSTSDVLAGCKC